MNNYLIIYRTNGFDFSILVKAHDFDDAVKEAKEQAVELNLKDWVITMVKEVENQEQLTSAPAEGGE